MKQINKRKFTFIFLMAVGVGSMTVAYQNFTSGPNLSETMKKDASLSDALSAAMQTAEQDHLQKQIALNVEPSQVENNLKKKRQISTVEVQTDMATDDETTARAVKPSRAPASSDDFE